jgi:polar amino acid transport system substrate-binding protein
MPLTRRAGLLGLVAPLDVATAAKPLRIASGDYPPYADPRRADGGIVTARLRAAFAQQGVTTHFEYMPWARALEQTRRGFFDASSYWWSDEELPRDFHLSRPLVSNALRWLRRRDRPLRPGDTVALVLGYNYPPGVQAALRRLRLRSQTVHQDLAGIRMVLLARAQAIPVDEGNACELVAQLSQKERDLLTLQPAAEPLDLQPGVVLLPRVLAQSGERLRLLNAGLAATLPPLALVRGEVCTRLTRT